MSKRLTTIMNFIDEERAKDRDREADIDLMNAICEELELRIARLDDEDDTEDRIDDDDDDDTDIDDTEDDAEDV